jgi:DNA-binding transcriptional regulator YiaG
MKRNIKETAALLGVDLSSVYRWKVIGVPPAAAQALRYIDDYVLDTQRGRPHYSNLEIRALRKRLGLNQTEFGKRAGLVGEEETVRGTVSDWELGKRPPRSYIHWHFWAMDKGHA